MSTSLPEKLPAGIRALFDEAQPVPPGVSFFEESFVGSGLAMMKRAVWGALSLLAGIVLVPTSIYELFRPKNNLTHAAGGWIGTDAVAVKQSIHAWHPAPTPPVRLST